jgi:hypothetical protein
MNKPELIIGYEGNGLPVSAVCSSCGTSVSEGLLNMNNLGETLETFQQQFQAHVQDRHQA